MTRKCLLRILFGLGALVVMCAPLFAEDDPYPCVAEGTSSCAGCHNAGSPPTAALTNPTQTCDHNCETCHEDMDSHHPTGASVGNAATLDLPLLSGNRLACVTCHDLSTHRHDSVAWKSQSLFDMMFRWEDRYPTYYLRINNRSGALCKTCH